MNTIAIVYYSGSGHTALMAEAVRRGASVDNNTHAALLPIDERKINEGRFVDEDLMTRLNEADALVFGTPTYMGGASAQFKSFADATSGTWYSRGWVGKVAAGFTHSGSPSGDKLSTLQYLSLFAAQHGMIWIGNSELPSGDPSNNEGINRLNSFIGVMGYGNQPGSAQAVVHPGDLLTAELLGRRVGDFLSKTKPGIHKS